MLQFASVNIPNTNTTVIADKEIIRITVQMSIMAYQSAPALTKVLRLNAMCSTDPVCPCRELYTYIYSIRWIERGRDCI